jgi:hypothetical protein
VAVAVPDLVDRLAEVHAAAGDSVRVARQQVGETGIDDPPGRVRDGRVPAAEEARRDSLDYGAGGASTRCRNPDGRNRAG